MAARRWGHPYCIDPGGIAYGYPLDTPYTDIQVTVNTARCGAATFSADWADADTGTYTLPQTPSCLSGTEVSHSTYWVFSVANDCDGRVWVHESDNDQSPGNTFCMDPLSGDVTYQFNPGEYWKVLVTGNQAQCTEGAAPYTP